MDRLFDLYLAKADQPDSGAYAELSLPATPCQMQDAMDKLRLAEGETMYWEITGYHAFEELSKVLNETCGLHELNALAQRLSGLDDQQRTAFAGLLQMEQAKGGPIPISRLIDLAYSTGCCHVVGDALNDSLLGWFCAENGFVPGAEELPDTVFALLDFERIGREYRQREGGILVSRSASYPGGYVEQYKPLEEVYKTLDLEPKTPDYAILLEGSRRSVPEPVRLKLPAAPEVLELQDGQEAGWRCLDCKIPSLMEMISDTEDISAVNQLARKLADMEPDTLNAYKALLSIRECETLQQAEQLMDTLDQYIFCPQYSSPTEAAQGELSIILADPGTEPLVPYLNLHQYGTALLRKYGGVLTDYGMIERKDCRPPVQEAGQGGEKRRNRFDDLAGRPGTPQEQAWIRERLETLSVRESYALAAALMRAPPGDAREAIGCLRSLDRYEICLAGNYEQLGRLYLRQNSKIFQEALPYVDLEKLGRQYEEKHPGLFLGNCYVACPPQPSPIQEQEAPPPDSDWSVKLRLASPSVPEGVWLRLPDYTELESECSIETELVLEELRASCLEECTLLEARCILPGAGDLMEQYDSIEELVRDGSNLGYLMGEQGQGAPRWLERYAAALEYEDCHTLKFALDIALNLSGYEYVPCVGLASFAESRLRNEGVPEEILHSGSISLDEYGADLLESSGYMLTEDKRGFVSRNTNQFTCYYIVPGGPEMTMQ